MLLKNKELFPLKQMKNFKNNIIKNWLTVLHEVTSLILAIVNTGGHGFLKCLNYMLIQKLSLVKM